MSESYRSTRVCLLTGGGDAPGLNAAVRAFVHAATKRRLLVYASHYGFEGLLGRAEVVPLRLEDVRGILPRGGSILGCSTKSNPFTLPTGELGARDAMKVVHAKIRELGIDALVLAGGDGTMSMAARLAQEGLHCIGIPKTIDGDVSGTEQTCGVDTAVETATHAVDALHSTAEAHQRVMIVEVMGRYAGFVALRSGIAGGADVVLVPEIPYDVARVVAKIHERESLGRRFSIVVVGEGARPVGGALSEVESARGGQPARLGGAGERLASELRTRDVRHDVRVTVLGHLQRGGTPTAADRLLATRFGAHAAELCEQGRFGRMVALRAGRVDSVPIAETHTLRAQVEGDGDLIRCARAVGIELGAPPPAES
jgi:6-phosphofructokinase 1